MTQQQVKALEEEARTRIQADEIRAARFGKAMERVLDEVQSLAARVGSEENGTSQRVAILEVIFGQGMAGNCHWQVPLSRAVAWQGRCRKKLEIVLQRDTKTHSSSRHVLGVDLQLEKNVGHSPGL